MENEIIIQSLKLLRLNKDLEIIENLLKENEQVEKNEKDNIFKKLSKNVSNSVKKSKTESLEKNKASDNEELVKVKETKDLIDDYTKLKSIIDDEFKSEESKDVLSLSYLLTDSFEYKDSEETLKTLSELIYNNKEVLLSLKKNINSHYNKIGGSLIFGSIKSSPSTILALKGYLNATNKKSTSYENALETLKDKDKKPIAILALLLLGKDYLPYSKDDQYIDEFFSLSKEELLSALSVRGYLLSKRGDEIKSEAKVILASLSRFSLKSQIAIIIDKVDVDNYKEKLNIISGFILDIESLIK